MVFLPLVWLGHKFTLVLGERIWLPVWKQGNVAMS